MKSILEFKLPEEREQFQLAINRIVRELDQYLHSKLKYEELTDEQPEAYDNLRSKLRELASEEGVI